MAGDRRLAGSLGRVGWFIGALTAPLYRRPGEAGCMHSAGNRSVVHNFQKFQRFLEENDVDWKIWKIYMRFSRGKRIFSSRKTFFRAVGKFKCRVFSSQIGPLAEARLENLESMAPRQFACLGLPAAARPTARCRRGSARLAFLAGIGLASSISLPLAPTWRGGGRLLKCLRVSSRLAGRRELFQPIINNLLEKQS